MDAIKISLRHGIEVATQAALDEGLIKQSQLDAEKDEVVDKKAGPKLNRCNISLITSPSYWDGSF